MATAHEYSSKGVALATLMLAGRLAERGSVAWTGGSSDREKQRERDRQRDGQRRTMEDACLDRNRGLERRQGERAEETYKEDGRRSPLKALGDRPSYRSVSSMGFKRRETTPPVRPPTPPLQQLPISLPPPLFHVSFTDNFSVRLP